MACTKVVTNIAGDFGYLLGADATIERGRGDGKRVR